MNTPHPTMMQKLRDVWLPRFFFTMTVALAALLALAVLLAPLLVDAETTIPIEPELVNLFAGDAVVRRTAIASALGLFVTAFVFFRAARTDPHLAKNSA